MCTKIFSWNEYVTRVTYSVECVARVTYLVECVTRVTYSLRYIFGLTEPSPLKDMKPKLTLRAPVSVLLSWFIQHLVKGKNRTPTSGS